MQKLFNFLLVGLAFTVLQVATVGAEEEKGSDQARQGFSGSEESSEPVQATEEPKGTPELVTSVSAHDDTESQVEENVPTEHDIYSIDRWGIRGGQKGRAAWQERDRTE
jgi:hypothetical protein